ncbi:DENN domain-containing protein 5B [Camellia lanceoleosa]|uniref:DENN domain-containing protein 5B n=1 Tax=Camellia lanceoleosa TaxID=1840588 RepID=A0ACC0F9A1_9ERIC|nr:DENN domain-containing protein 5B [Camellia lanceoleosa]
METKEDGDAQEEWPTSPYQVLQHISEEAVRVAGEAIQSVYVGSSPNNIQPSEPPGHRRSQSEVLTKVHKRNNSFQRLKTHMQKALRWGSNSREQTLFSSFNPEILANQKRQWYQLHSKSLDQKKYEEPMSLFEHLIIVGLHPDANLDVVEDAFAKRKKWESEMQKYEMMDLKLRQYRGPSFPTLEPQILFKYPPGKRLSVRPKDLTAFCFPGGVKARVLERTPSLSDLNELVYGQEHLCNDDMSFIFSLKVADNATLYGVCLHVQEMVQRPPAMLGAASPISQSSGISRLLASAPRCYCVLTRVPFFELHYEMLNSIIAQDRLNRITQFVTEISLTDYIPSGTKLHDPMNDSPYRDCCTDWMASAIPVDSAIALTAAAAGIVLDDVPSTSCRWESVSPESGSISGASDYSQTKDTEKDGKKNLHYFDDNASETSENRFDGLERMSGSCDNGQTPPEVGTCVYRRSPTLERLGSSESLFRYNGQTPPEVGTCVYRRSPRLDRLESSESLFSPARSIGSEDEDDEIFFYHEKVAGDDIIMEWARENKNDLLQIVCGYHAMSIPTRGSEIVFHPLEHLQAIAYRRPPVSALDLSERYLDQQLQQSLETAEVNLKLSAAEEALSLSIWTTATICRVLSLESVLAFITGVLLEKQVVVVCPNLGVLSAIILSFIPMIRPFEWQSLFLPVLPGKMLYFIDAPVPFIVGVQQKPADWKKKTSNLVLVNVVKDQVKTCYLPALPRRKELISELQPIHTRLSCEKSIAKRRPVYKCNEVQAEAAAQFLTVMRRYLESLCSNLRSHTITSVQSNNDRVSLLLKDSFIDSFPSKDQPFIKLFVDTQLFTVLSDSRLSNYENEY